MPRIVVVTGSSAGIGRATAIAFGARGDTVVLVARGAKGLAGAAAQVERAGGTAHVMPADVADSDQVFAVAHKVEADLGPIDIWVNVAFTSVFSPFDQIKPEEYRRVTEVSYLGFPFDTMAALSHMKPRDRGTVVQVGSALAYRGIPLQSAYCGAKHAIQGFHEALRCELLHDKSNVHVTMVQLPAVDTPQFSWVLSLGCPTTRSRFHRSINLSSPRAEFYTQLTIPDDASIGSGARWPRTRSLQVCSTATWARPDSVRSRPSDRTMPTRRSTCGTQLTVRTAKTSAPTASSNSSPTNTIRNYGRRIITACSASPRQPWQPSRSRHPPLPTGDGTCDGRSAYPGAAIGPSRRWQTDREWGLRRYAANGPRPVPASAIGLSRRIARVRRAHRRHRRGRGAGRRGCGVGSMVRHGPRCRSVYTHGMRECPMISTGALRGWHIERPAGQLSRASFDGRHDVPAVV